MNMASNDNHAVKVLTRLVHKCTDEKHRKFGLLNQDELRAVDELVHSSNADNESKHLFWGAVLEYRSRMVAHSKFR